MQHLRSGVPVLFAFGLALSFWACNDAKPAANPLSQPFPDGFLWGTAVAGFQVDMGCPSAADACIDHNSDWSQWVTSQTIIDAGLVHGDPLEYSPAHWELYEQDFDLAKNELHNNAFRLSFEWSRLFPSSTTGVDNFTDLRALADPTALQHYHDIFAALKARGIVPLVTVNHYTLPLWIHDGVACYNAFEAGNVDACPAKGWLDGDVFIAELAKFAGFVAKEYGDAIDLWATLNEPYAVILAGYALPTPQERTNPPGINAPDFEFAAPVIRAHIVAHARMYDAIKANDNVDADGDGGPAMVGIVMNMADAYPNNPQNASDVQAVKNFHYFYNYLFLDALTTGAWDEGIDGEQETTRADLAKRMDYVGINYYTSPTLIGGDSIADFAPIITFIPNSVVQSKYKPEGLYAVVKLVQERYNLPMYITENGRADSYKPNGAAALIPHLAWLKKAIDEGADVRGYFYWSLTDNYEWNHGYSLKFGLYSYDAVSKARVAKPHAPVYGRIAKENAIAQDLLEQYGGEFLPSAATAVE